ncbi:hypothetical protein DFH07DRAFT_812855, partial [Mycena maculata]
MFLDKRSGAVRSPPEMAMTTFPQSAFARPLHVMDKAAAKIRAIILPRTIPQVPSTTSAPRKPAAKPAPRDSLSAVGLMKKYNRLAETPPSQLQPSAAGGIGIQRKRSQSVGSRLPRPGSRIEAAEALPVNARPRASTRPTSRMESETRSNAAIPRPTSKVGSEAQSTNAQATSIPRPASRTGSDVPPINTRPTAIPRPASRAGSDVPPINTRPTAIPRPASRTGSELHPVNTRPTAIPRPASRAGAPPVYTRSTAIPRPASRTGSDAPPINTRPAVIRRPASRKGSDVHPARPTAITTTSTPSRAAAPANITTVAMSPRSPRAFPRSPRSAYNTQRAGLVEGPRPQSRGRKVQPPEGAAKEGENVRGKRN